MSDAADEAMTALYLYALMHSGTPSGSLVTQVLLSTRPAETDTGSESLAHVSAAIGLLHVLDEHIDGADGHRDALAKGFRDALVADEIRVGVGV